MSLLEALLLDPPRIDIWVEKRTDSIAGSDTQIGTAQPLNPKRQNSLANNTTPGNTFSSVMALIQALVLVRPRIDIYAAVAAVLMIWPNGMAFSAVFFEVPNGFEDVQGNDVSRLPFGYAHPNVVRYQQVCDASAFSLVPSGGAFVTHILFRADCTTGWGPVVTNLQVKLSTTFKSADQLSALFVENVGEDETTVFDQRDYLDYFPPSHWSLPNCPNPRPAPFGNPISLNVPFFYNPARGNLLMEFRVSGVRPFCLPPYYRCDYSWRLWNPLEEGGHPYNKLDAVTVPGDSISRVAAFSLTTNTNTAEVVDTTGLVTAFQFFPVPSLRIGYETNTLTILFPLNPKAFVLQCSQTLGPGAVWVDYPGQAVQIGINRVVKIPGGSLQAPRFFRLACESCRLPAQSSALERFHQSTILRREAPTAAISARTLQRTWEAGQPVQ